VFSGGIDQRVAELKFSTAPFPLITFASGAAVDLLPLFLTQLPYLFSDPLNRSTFHRPRRVVREAGGFIALLFLSLRFARKAPPKSQIISFNLASLNLDFAQLNSARI